MGPFGRAVEIALKYRATLAGMILCSLVVAFFWGANIGTLYPALEVTFQGDSLQSWARKQIAQCQENEQDLAQRLAALDQQKGTAAADDLPRIEGERDELQTQLFAEQQARATLEWAQPWIDNWLPRGPFETLAWMIGALIVGSLIKDAFLALNMYLVDRLANLAVFDLRKEFYRRTLRMDLRSFGQEHSAQLMSRFTNDVESLRAGLNVLFGTSVREPLKMVACLIGAALICWPLLLVSLIITPLAAVLIHWLSTALRRANKRALEEISVLYRQLSETFNGIEAVKGFTMERYERRQFHRSSKEFYHKSMRIALYNALTKPTMEAVGIAVICSAILAGAYLVLNKETHLFGIWMSDRPLSLASVLVFYAMLAGAADPMRRMTDVWTYIQRGNAAAERVFELFDREPEVQDPEQPIPLPSSFQELRFEEVSYAHNPQQPTLRSINLTFGARETIAIVGPNGCGKSTLARLIPRFFDPDSGALRIDGIDLRDVRLAELRGRIGIVSQQTQLFDDTIEANIRYGAFDATSEEIRQAAKRAHAHEFIVEKPEGYDYQVGTGGARLSGGQRQRIALARAMLRDPDILILDEATSQVDLESEQLIHEALAEFIRGRLAIIITHRLATLQLADRIVVMDEGRILDVGAHDELVARCALYRRLHEIQFSRAA